MEMDRDALKCLLDEATRHLEAANLCNEQMAQFIDSDPAIAVQWNELCRMHESRFASLMKRFKNDSRL